MSRNPAAFRFAAMLALALAPMLAPIPAHAVTLNVAPGAVTIADDDLCSLREAMHNAESTAQVDNDDCPAGSGGLDILELAAEALYTLTDADPSASGANGLPIVTTALTIRGNGAVIERDPTFGCSPDKVHDADEFRILMVDSGGDVTLEDLTLRGGCADGNGSPNDGGGILVNNGSLTLTRVLIDGNTAWDKSGGLDTSGAAVLINDSVFTDNSAGGGGGAIGNGGGSTMTITGSTVSGNGSGGEGGGGIGNFGTLVVRNSTISGNSSTGTGGGGIGNQEGILDIDASTITDNSVTGPLGGGGLGNAGTLTLKNSIVGANGAGGDCINLATFTADGLNFDTDGSCAALDASFTQVTPAELALGALADNGGPTQTHALLAGSVAIDALGDCTQIGGALPLDTDQRGSSRLQDGDDDGMAACDAGAFEVQNLDILVVDGTCTLGDAIEAANLDMITVGGCVDASAGPDTLILDIDTVLTVPDLVRSSLLLDAYAGLPDITSEILIQSGQADTIERAPQLTCDVADAAEEFRLFNITSGSLTLDGVTLKNGCADQGGAILVQGGLSVLGSSFLGNTAEAGSQDGRGGAIRIESGAEVTIEGALFENNLARGRAARGGAIDDDGGLVRLTSSRFLSNQALAVQISAEGGAVFLNSPALLSDLVFEGNLAQGGDAKVGSGGSGYGGALYVNAAGGSLSHSVARGNIALGGEGESGGGDGFGGAILMEPAIDLDRVSLIANRGEGGPGATLRGGDAKGGGLWTCDTAEIRHLTASGNIVQSGDSTSGVGGEAGGGGIWIGCGPATLRHLTLAENQAIAGLGGGGIGTVLGAGLTAADTLIESSLLEGNTATAGGAPTASDCANEGKGSFLSLGFNTVASNTLGTTSPCDFTAVGDQVDAGASLLPVGDHGCAVELPGGGCLPTHPVALDGPALDQGSCTASTVVADARGLSRPWDAPGVVNVDDGCDAGAYESRDEDVDLAEDGVDNCPGLANPGQEDADLDNVGDACDLCEGDDATGDGDSDGICLDRDCDDTDGLGASCELFADGFESGDLSAWSLVVF